MRAVLLSILTVFVAALAFGIYWQFSGGTVPTYTNPTTRPTTQAVPVEILSSQHGISPGERPAWMRYDAVTGKPVSRIRSKDYERLPDGRYKVNDPQVDFFLSNGQLLRITGKQGFIVLQEGLARGNASAAASDFNKTPRSGDLQDVIVEIFPSLDATRPTTTMTMHNASFDNETYRIQTEEYVQQNGKRIPGDQVPVVITGAEYEFDGKGLQLQYNEVDKRLEYLRVNQGKRLLIKNPGQLFRSSATARPAALGLNIPSNRYQPIPGILLAAADNAAVAEAVKSRPRPPKSKQNEFGETLYRASFKDKVVVTQIVNGTRLPLASAAELQVDFLTEDGGLENLGGAPDPANKQQADNPQSKRDRLRAQRATTRAATRPTTQKSVVKSPATQAAATRPAEPPIEITWSGPLVIVPLPDHTPERIAPGESIVRLIGAPGQQARLTRTTDNVTTTITGGSLTHWTLDQGALLLEGHGFPVELREKRNGLDSTHIITRKMEFSEKTRQAVLSGPSSARLPIDDHMAPPAPAHAPANAAAKPIPNSFMNVQWADNCTIAFDGNGGLENMVMKRADLRGKVNIDHPQLTLDSESLGLAFAPSPPAAGAVPDPAAKPNARSSPSLQSLDAQGKVRCNIRDDTGAEIKQTVNCDNLLLATAPGKNGKFYPRQINAMGHVHAVDADRDLTAGFVNLILHDPADHPAAAPADKAADQKAAKREFDLGDLKSLVASDQVRIKTADGKRAQADRLTLDTNPDKTTTVRLTGSPATVFRERDKLTGPLIEFSPESQEFKVVGAGRIDAVRQASTTQPATPVTVTWEKDLAGKGDEIAATGAVKAESTDPDGTVNVAKAQRVTLLTKKLEPKPAAPADAQKPAGAAAQKPEAKPASRKSEFDAMSDRQIEGITLEGQAETTSTLHDANGKLLRLAHLMSEKIIYSQPAGQPKSLNIPGAGKMIVVDDRPPGDTAQAKEAASDPMGVRGRTAFSWDKSLTYDEKASQVKMTGNVEVARLAQGGNQGEHVQPLHIFGDQIIADVVPAPENPAMPAPKKPGLDSDFSNKIQLKRVRVLGSVAVKGPKINIEAEQIEFDPVTHRLTATGTPNKPVVQRDNDGLEVARFDKFVWDTQRNLIDSENAVFSKRK